MTDVPHPPSDYGEPVPTADEMLREIYRTNPDEATGKQKRKVRDPYPRR